MDKERPPEIPFLTYTNDVVYTINRGPISVEEEKQWVDAQATSFSLLFRGNPNGFYLRRDDGSYHAVKREVTHEDWIAHLLNMPDSRLLIIPVRPDGTCFWAVIDIDRHGEDDVAVDWPELARRVTELKLPLVVCQSGGGKGAHLFCFFREKQNGIPAADARSIMKHYLKLLSLPEGTEVFPKQNDLDTLRGLGNGVNMPYNFIRGWPAVAYDPEGRRLDPMEAFLDLAWERSMFGSALVRDLPEVESKAVVRAPATDRNRPMKAADAREQYEKYLTTLRSAAEGEGNALLNTTAFFAGRAMKALGKPQDQVEAELLSIVTKEWKHPHPYSGAQASIRSGLTSGIADPLTIVHPPTLPWRNSSKQITVEKSPAIVDRLLYLGSSTALIAKPKVGKTTFALDVCECILYGRSFLKEPVVQGSVLYVSEQPLGSFVAEMYNSGLQSSGQLTLESGAPKGEFEYVTIEDWHKFSWNDIIEATVAHAVKIGACLVVFDTLSRIARVKDENNASEVQAAIDEMTPFLQHGISTLIVQHERKSGGDISDAGRGTGALAGTVDVLLRLTKPVGNHPDSYRSLEFIGRYPGPGEPRILDRKTADSHSRYEMLGSLPAVKSVDNQQAVMDLFPDSEVTLTEDEAVAATSLDKTAVHRALGNLVEHGLLERAGDGKRGSPFQYKARKREPIPF